MWIWRPCAAAAIAVASLLVAPAAFADSAPIPNTPDLPWTNPAHQSSLELLAGQIASRVANRQVTIRCEGDNDWRTLVTQQGGDPDAELGYVASRWYASGRLSDISTFAELTGSVCLSLQQFAAATAKPTKCAGTVQQTTTVYKSVRVKVVRKGRARWVIRQVPATVTTAVPGPPAPCYAGGRAAQPMPDSFWSDYRRYALAMLVLAHESIHLGGAVGGVLSNGLVVGDQQAEAHADCYGLQWIPFVAEQLGDTPDDAQAIATYAYDEIYPDGKGTPYWSADCVPGGSMDIRPAGATAWP